MRAHRRRGRWQRGRWRCGRWRCDRADDGVATVWTAIAIAGLLTMAVLMFWLGTAAVTRHRAVTAADLAALAAAAHTRHGPVAACAKAGSVAGHMGARLVECRFEGSDALVRVEITPDGLLSRFGAARARARAGPVGAAHRGAGGAVRTMSGTSGGYRFTRAQSGRTFVATRAPVVEQPLSENCNLPFSEMCRHRDMA